MVRNLSAIPARMESPGHVINNSNSGSGGRCERRSRRKRTKKAVATEIPVDDWTKANKEARRCDVIQVDATRTSNAEIPLPIESLDSLTTNDVLIPTLPDDFEASLEHLLAAEFVYHPKTDSLFRGGAEVEDKVDARLRDEAIFNLRFLHKFHNLAPECFANAVNISDRFIVKIKVKPKYMACLATAAYRIACKMIENPKDWPSPERLVTVARCGGSPSDLERMEAIIHAKLADPSLPRMEKAVTPLHFLQLLQPLFPSARSYQRAVGDLEICLCSVAVYSYRPAMLALGVAKRYLDGSGEAAAAALFILMKALEVSDSDVRACELVLDAESQRVQTPRTPAPRTLVWNLSRRTITNLQKPSAAAQAHMLDPIREDRVAEESDDCLLEMARRFD